MAESYPSAPRPAADARPTEEQIRRMVHEFYGRVRRDPLLGPIFERRLAGRWDPHLERMVGFWTSVLLASGRYAGDPMETHRGVQGIGPEHFDRWLELFHETTHDVFPQHVAIDIYTRASRMRVALERYAMRAG